MTNRKSLLILAGLYLFHLLNNYFWLKADARYLLFDPAWHHQSSLIIFEHIKNSPFLLFFPSLERSGFFVYLITAPFYFIFGSSQHSAIMINGAFFLAILLFSIYGIGVKLKDKKNGLLAAFIVSMYPIVFNQLRVYMFDLPLCAFVSLNIYLLICSDRFKNKPVTFLYFLSLFLGSMIKFNFLIFIVSPLVLVLFKKQKSNILQRKRLIILSAIATGLILFFGFYSLKLTYAFLLMSTCLKNVLYSPLGTYGQRFMALFPVWYYSGVSSILNLVNNSFSFFFSLVFTVSLCLVLKTKFKSIAFLLPVVLIPFFLINFVFVTQGFAERYLLPSLSVFALITAFGVMGIKRAGLRKFIVILILCFGFIQYFSISYGCRWLPGRVKISLPDSFLRSSFFFKNFALLDMLRIYEGKIGYSGEIVLWQQEMNIFLQRGFSHPDNDQRARQNVNTIMENCPFIKGDTFIFLDYNSDIADILYPLKYEISRKFKTTDMVKDPLFLNYNDYPNKYEPVSQYLLSVDYVAVIKDALTEEFSDLNYYPALKEEIRMTKEYFFEHIDAFSLACEVELPDKRKLSVYKNTSNIIEDGPLEIRVNNQRVMLFYRGRRITENNGLCAYFRCNRRYYSSFDTNCKLEKVKPDSLILRYSWPDLGVSQEWELSLENKRLRWRIYLDNPWKLPLEDLGSELRLIPGYGLWQDNFGSGPIPDLSPWHQESLRINRKMPVGSELMVKPAGNLPVILCRPQDRYLEEKSIDLYTLFFERQKCRVIDFNLLGPKSPPGGGKELVFLGDFYFIPQEK